MKKISVIVPVYKVEKYIDRCLNSIVNQSYKNTEIILIDDGSPDNCPKMCEDWAKKDSRIKVIHKQNEGLGFARNTGMENATGDYVWFVDSDDYISNESLQILADAIENSGNADIIIFGHNRILQNGKTVNYELVCEKQIYTNSEVQDIFLPNLIFNVETQNLMASSCMCLFKNSTLQNSKIKFCSEREIISEDLHFLFRYYSNVHTAYVLSKPLYNYCQNEISLTQVYRKDRVEKIFLFYEEMCRQVELLGYNQEVKKRINAPLENFIVAALKQEVSAACEKTGKEKYEFVKAVLQNEKVINAASVLKTYPCNFKKKIFYYFVNRKRFFLAFLLLYFQALTDK